MSSNKFQFKRRKSEEWEELFPITKAEFVKCDNEKTLQEVLLTANTEITQIKDKIEILEDEELKNKVSSLESNIKNITEEVTKISKEFDKLDSIIEID